MGRRAVVAILIVIIALLLPAPQGAIASPDIVAAVGGRLVDSAGAHLFLLGANYVGGPDRSWTMWQDGLFDAGRIEQDFLRAKAAGLNTLRIFVRAPLQQEIAADRWGKLDAVVGLAERHGLFLVVTFADYREDDLAKVAAVDGAVARRYAGRHTILAYDLKNEPHFQDLAISQYPSSPPPLQTDVLIKRYGERLTPAQADAWRQSDEGKNLIPVRFSSRETYLYANNLGLYREFLKEAGEWITARNFDVTTLDYIDAPDSERWRPLLGVLDQTLAAWLKPAIEAIRAGDRERLITVGYSDVVLARLSANNALGFVSVHRFPSVGLKPLRATFDLLGDLRGAFPERPIVFEEFGYSSAGVDAGLTAAYETATILHLMSQGMAGGAKWSLYDLAQGWNERENNFGLYRADGSPKPVVGALHALGDYVRASPVPPGQLTLDAEPGAPGLRYVYAASDALFVAAPKYADPLGRLDFDAAAPIQVFVSWPGGSQVSIATTAAATLRLDLAKLLGVVHVRDLTLQRSDGADVPFQRQGDLVTVAVEGGQTYRLRFTTLAVDARIEIVWPHGDRPVREAQRANIGAYIFEQGTGTVICPQLAPTVRLWRALNNDVEEEVDVGQIRSVSHNSLRFAAWDFDNVDVSAARDPQNKYYLRLSVDGYPSRSSIWSHAVDARTYLPNPDVPTGVVADVPGEVDAKIQIVWPHDNLPVNRATKANVAAALFQRDALQSVPANWSPVVHLWRALNNGFGERVAVGQKVLKQVGNLIYPVWEFNDVDVSKATDPLNKYYFQVTVDGVKSRSNVWSHGADARTYFPQQDVPAGVGTCR